jgi:hypothetical protein
MGSNLAYTLFYGTAAIAMAQAARVGPHGSTVSLVRRLFTSTRGRPRQSTGPRPMPDDADGSMAFDERLRVTGIACGQHDGRFTDKRAALYRDPCGRQRG